MSPASRAAAERSSPEAFATRSSLFAITAARLAFDEEDARAPETLSRLERAAFRLRDAASAFSTFDVAAAERPVRGAATVATVSGGGGISKREAVEFPGYALDSFVGAPVRLSVCEPGVCELTT